MDTIGISQKLIDNLVCVGVINLTLFSINLRLGGGNGIVEQYHLLATHGDVETTILTSSSHKTNGSFSLLCIFTLNFVVNFTTMQFISLLSLNFGYAWLLLILIQLKLIYGCFIVCWRAISGD